MHTVHAWNNKHPHSKERYPLLFLLLLFFIFYFFALLQVYFFSSIPLTPCRDVQVSPHLYSLTECMAQNHWLQKGDTFERDVCLFEAKCERARRALPLDRVCQFEIRGVHIVHQIETQTAIYELWIILCGFTQMMVIGSDSQPSLYLFSRRPTRQTAEINSDSKSTFPPSSLVRDRNTHT